MTAVGYVDTTLRDLATYPWGSGIDADELAAAAAALAPIGAQVLEAIDPRCARAALELRTESPWDRLRAIVRHAGRTPVGIVVAGRMLWGDRPLAADVVRRFVLCAAESGARRVRALDPLNQADMLEAAARAAQEAGIDFVPTLVVGPSPGVDDARWAQEARELAALPGAAAICVSDGSGHLTPAALASLVSMVKSAGLPVEVLVQAPGGLAALSVTAAIAAGADAVYAAAGPVAMTAARASAETLRASLVGGRELAVDRDALNEASRAITPLLTADRLSQAASAVFGPAVSLPPDLEMGLLGRLGRLGLSGQLVEVADEVGRLTHELGGLTLAYPFGDAIVEQAADHIIDQARWTEINPILAGAVLGQFGRLRGPVDPAAQAAAEAVGPIEVPSDVALDAVAHGAPVGLSEEDLVLLAQFPDEAERLIARRRSLRTEVPEEGTVIDRALLETLVQMVESSGETEVSVEQAGTRVTVRRAAPMAAVAAPGAPAAEIPVDDGMARVESPMVGTFYRASSPEAGPFVTEGQKVEAGQTVCLIEAMKLFNEIHAETAGTIRRIAVQNAEPVEFGQLLFLIEP